MKQTLPAALLCGALIAVSVLVLLHTKALSVVAVGHDFSDSPYLKEQRKTLLPRSSSDKASLSNADFDQDAHLLSDLSSPLEYNHQLKLNETSKQKVSESSAPLDWNDQHSEVLERLVSQRLNSTFVSSQQRRVPRLPLPAKHNPDLGNASDPLTHGVFFAGSGDIAFVERRMLPALRHLIHGLKIPRAKERAKIRQRYQNTSTFAVANTGFALLASRDFQESPLLKDMLNFFDIVYDPIEDLPDWPKGWRQALQSGKQQATRGHAKATKAHAMASSPFDVTVFMDFDNFPCRPDFMGPLLQLFQGSDLLLSNKYTEMNNIPKGLEEHWMAEHNTAMVLLNMTSTRTRHLLGLYVEAFHAMWEMHPANAPIPPRDQPAFMIALRALRQLNVQPTPPDDKTVFLDHVDIPHDVFCRRRTMPEGQPLVCGGSSPCILAHKPDRIMIERVSGPNTGTKSHR